MSVEIQYSPFAHRRAVTGVSHGIIQSDPCWSAGATGHRHGRESVRELFAVRDQPVSQSWVGPSPTRSYARPEQADGLYVERA